MSDDLNAALRASEAATREHSDALRRVRAEIARTTDIAQAVAATDRFLTEKFIADVLSGRFARQCRRRPFNFVERTLGLLVAVYALWSAVQGRRA